MGVATTSETNQLVKRRLTLSQSRRSRAWSTLGRLRQLRPCGGIWLWRLLRLPTPGVPGRTATGSSRGLWVPLATESSSNRLIRFMLFYALCRSCAGAASVRPAHHHAASFASPHPSGCRTVLRPARRGCIASNSAPSLPPSLTPLSRLPPIELSQHPQAPLGRLQGRPSAASRALSSCLTPPRPPPPLRRPFTPPERPQVQP